MRTKIAFLLIAFIIISILFASFICAGTDQKEMKLKRPVFTVYVDASVHESFIENSILSTTKRELRSLGDVICTDLDEIHQYTIGILFMEIHTVTSEKVGFGFSYVFLKNNYPSDKTQTIGTLNELSAVLQSDGKIKEYNAVQESVILTILANRFYQEYLDAGLMTGSSNEYMNVCLQNIISSFDQKVLEPERKMYRNIKKSVEDDGYKVIEE